MNKNEFFTIIKEGLNDFPNQELEDILYDYEEHFRNAKAEGKTDEEILSELGDPYIIVNQYRSGYVERSPKYENKKNNSFNDIKPTNNNINKLLKIAIVVALIILVGPFGFSAIVSVASVLIAIFFIPISFTIATIALILGKFGISLIGFSAPNFLIDMPMSSLVMFLIGSIAFSLLLLILFIYFVKLIIVLIKKLINKISGKEEK